MITKDSSTRRREKKETHARFLPFQIETGPSARTNEIESRTKEVREKERGDGVGEKWSVQSAVERSNILYSNILILISS